MSSELKAALAGLVVAAIAVLTIVLNTYLGDTPVPEPTPSPSPTVTPSPTPTIPAVDVMLRGSRNEVLGRRLAFNVPDCQPIAVGSEQFETSFYTIESEVTTHRSYRDARLGEWENYLEPTTDVCPDDKIWMDLKIPVDTEPGTYGFEINGLDVAVEVWSMTMPDRFALPAYSAISTWGVLQAHLGNPPEGGDWAAEWRIGERYVQAAIAHGFYPFGFTPTNRVRNATDLARLIQYSPGWLWIPIRGPRTNIADSGFDWSTESLQAADAIDFPRDKVIYLYDEPRGLGNVQTSDMQTSISLVRQHAPSLKVFITMNYEDIIDVDIWSPVQEYLFSPYRPGLEAFPSGSRVCSYVSCMTSSCAENGDLSGTPGFEVELPPVYRRAIAWITHHLKLECFLYYHMNVEFGNRLANDGYSIWHYEGGNGDGQIFGPPDLEYHRPTVTLRMKEWREAAYDYQYLQWANADVSSLVRTTLDWDKEYANYQAMRDQIGAQLNGGTQ